MTAVKRPSYVPDLPVVDAWTTVWQSQLDVTLSAANAWMRAFVSPWLNVGDITIYYPFGKGYHQVIDPDTNWGWIGSTETDHPDIEREIATDVASYGKQLGRMMNLLVDLAESPDSVDPERVRAVRELKDRIDGVKRKHGLASANE